MPMVAEGVATRRLTATPILPNSNTAPPTRAHHRGQHTGQPHHTPPSITENHRALPNIRPLQNPASTLTPRRPDGHAQQLTLSQPRLQDLSRVMPHPQSGRLPDEIYHKIRRTNKVIQHLHTKGSTALIALILDRLRATGDIRNVPLGRQLSHQLSIHGRSTKKSETTGELMPVNDLASYREQYANLSNVAKTPEGALLTYFELMNEQAAHGVKYVEFRTGLPNKGDPEAFILCCERGCAEAQAALALQEKEINYGIIILINRGGDSTLDPESLTRHNVQLGIDQAEAAIKLRRAGLPIVGIDLAGDERKHSVNNFKPVFDRIHDYNETAPPHLRLGITIHSGETDISTEYDGTTLSGYDSVERSVALGWHSNTPLRIGHGVRIVEHPEVAAAFKHYQQNPNCVKDPNFRMNLFNKAPLLKTLFNQQICLETCPKSNFQTGAVSSYATHPAFFFADLGLAVTVNPDNEIVSKTDPTNEFVKLYRSQPDFSNAHTLTDHQALFSKFQKFMYTCFHHGVRSAFIFDERLREKLIRYAHTLAPQEDPHLKMPDHPPLADMV